MVAEAAAGAFYPFGLSAQKHNSIFDTHTTCALDILQESQKTI